MSAAAELRPVSQVNPQPAFLFSNEDLNPEFELLLTCCALLPDGVRTDRIRWILTRPLDWERFLRLAEHNRVIPRVYQELSSLAPPGDLGAVRRANQQNARRSLLLTGELVRVLAHLESCGIEALPYKGPLLAQLLHGDVAGRQFTDLDVLIRAKQVPKAKAAILELGYQAHLSLSRRAERAYLVSGYEYVFDGELGRNLLEIQWQIMPRFYAVDFRVADFFDRSIEVTIAGRIVRTLCIEDLFLVLCVHAAKHAWTQLSWLCDIARLVESQPLDWDMVGRESRRLGVERIVRMNCLLTHRLLAAPLPRALKGTVHADEQIDSLAEQVLPILRQGLEYDTETVAYFRWMMRLRENRRDQARFLWRLAFTPSVGEWSAVNLSDKLFGLYRIVRLFRLAKRATLA